jgi:hypothetical protein
MNELPEGFVFDPSSLLLDECEKLEDTFDCDIDVLVGSLNSTDRAPFGVGPDGAPVRLTVNGRTVRRAGVLRALVAAQLSRTMTPAEAEALAGTASLRALGAGGKARRGAEPVGSDGPS